jgi:hypothetical protein
MPNYLDAHLTSSQQSDPHLNQRKMYLHLASAFLFGVVPAGVVYLMDDSLGLYKADPLPCGTTADMNAWLLTSGYASATYAGVTCFLLLCVTCTPGGEASTMQKMTCMNLTAQAFMLGLLLWFAKGVFDFNTKVDATVCYNYDAFRYYMYGGYGLLGSVVLFVAVIKILTARKGSLKKTVFGASSMY